MTDHLENPDHRLKRLRFRGWRRGFRELDLIMGGFADRHGAELTEPEIVEFEALLDQADQDVYAWIVGQAAIPEAFDTLLMARLRAFRPEPGQGA